MQSFRSESLLSVNVELCLLSLLSLTSAIILTTSSSSMSDSGSPSRFPSSGTITLNSLVERAVTRRAKREALAAQCAALQAQIYAAHARNSQEKIEERRLRMEIAAFLKERGATRAACECSETGTRSARYITHVMNS